MTLGIGDRRRMKAHTVRGRLRLSQECLEKRSNYSDSFDLVVACASWEPRCAAIVESHGIRATRTILVTYEEKGQTTSSLDNEARLLTWLKRISDSEPQAITLNSLSPAEGSLRLREITLRACFEISRPVRVLIDISSLSRFSFLSLVGFLLHTGIASEIVTHYAEAEYELAESSEYVIESTDELDELESHEALRKVQQISFSKYNYSQGEWATAVVPFMEGTMGLGSERRLYASLGFDGGPSYEVISRHDPDELIPVIANPGYTTKYTELAIRENAKLIASFDVLASRVVEAFPADIVTVFDKVAEAEQHISKPGDVLFFCLGSKPHALALGLVACTLNRPSVVCRVPQRYLERHTLASKFSWLFRIVDLSLPFARSV
jgi:hypothetical protein